MVKLARPLVAIVLLSGCPSREVAERATPEACQNACKHVVEIQQESARASSKIRVHELEEMLESQEDSAKENVARLKKELTIPEPKFEDSLEAQRKVSPAVKKQLRAQFERQVEDLRRSRLEGIAKEEEELKKSAALIAGLKKKNEADNGKAFDEEVKKCQADCVASRTAKEVRCLQLAQAPDDVTMCLPAGASSSPDGGAAAGK